MADTNEAFSRVKMDAQLKDQGWDILNTNTVALKNAEAALLALLARAYRIEPVIDVPTEEAAVA
jgi:hypothetical protein